VLEAFSHINRSYDNVELAIRSNLTPSIRDHYSEVIKMDNVFIYDQILSPNQMNDLFASADILLCPSLNGVPAMTTLFAMDFELPVISVNAGYNTEAIQDGINGFLVDAGQAQATTREDFARNGEIYRARDKPVRMTVVNGLIEKVGRLLEDETLRRRMGKNNKLEIREGRFSLRRRNEKLKHVLDLAGEREGDYDRRWRVIVNRGIEAEKIR